MDLGRLRRAALLALGTLACPAEDEPANDDAAGSDGVAADSSSDADTGVGGFPSACDPTMSPFLSADCLSALRDACRAHADESGCAGQATFQFDGYGVRCAWANVLTFADATSCTIASEASRCEATLVSLGSVGIPCTAFPSELEIVELVDGPLGPWSAVDSEPDDVGGCAPNTSPPAPALCDCAPASCEIP